MCKKLNIIYNIIIQSLRQTDYFRQFISGNWISLVYDVYTVILLKHQNMDIVHV